MVVKTYAPVWSKTFDDWGGTTSNQAYQGRYSAGAGGYEYTKWGFNYATIQADLLGATITKVEVFLDNTHFYSSSGGNAIIGTHNNATMPSGSASKNGTARRHAIAFSKGQAKWVTVSNAIGNEFKAGTTKGIMIGDWDSGSLSEYAYFVRYGDNGLRLRITYDAGLDLETTAEPFTMTLSPDPVQSFVDSAEPQDLFAQAFAFSTVLNLDEAETTADSSAVAGNFSVSLMYQVRALTLEDILDLPQLPATLTVIPSMGPPTEVTVVPVVMTEISDPAVHTEVPLNNILTIIPAMDAVTVIED